MIGPHSSNRVTDERVEAAAQACADFCKFHVNSIDRDLMRAILEGADAIPNRVAATRYRTIVAAPPWLYETFATALAANLGSGHILDKPDSVFESGTGVDECS